MPFWLQPQERGGADDPRLGGRSALEGYETLLRFSMIQNLCAGCLLTRQRAGAIRMGRLLRIDWATLVPSGSVYGALPSTGV